MLDFLLGHHTSAYTYSMIALFSIFLVQTAIFYPKLKSFLIKKTGSSKIIGSTGSLIYFSYTLVNSSVFLVLGGLTIASLSYL
ncbi:TPA: hypothetical protein ACQ2HY_003324 [Klebsiella pneumoniae]